MDKPNDLSRRAWMRRVATTGALAAGHGLLSTGCAEDERSVTVREPEPEPSRETPFRIAWLGDTHFIDEYYEGPESNALDTESLLLANDRFESARDRVVGVQPPVEAVFHVGDIIHRYPSSDLDFFFENRTSIDHAKERLDAMGAPVYACFGNHDYSFRRMERHLTHELFAEKMGLPPYHYVDLHGFRFIMLNNFLGKSFAWGTDDFNSDLASFGEEQLQWLEALLSERKPTFVFMHFYLPLWDPNEFGDFSINSILARYSDNILQVVSGHMHRWFRPRDRERQLPEQIILGSTRYDERSVAMVELDPVQQSWRFLNEEAFQYGNHRTSEWSLDDEA